MPHDAFESRRNSLEERYFHNKDAELIRKLNAVFDAKRDREALRAATGITSEEVLDRMMAVNARGEMLTAFNLLPLVEIAWADGPYEPREAEGVITAAMHHGVPADSAALAQLKTWLRHPDPQAQNAWYAYAAELRKTLTPAQLDAFRDDLLQTARRIAESSGGILSTFFRVSRGERAVLKRITDALTHTPGGAKR
jgi:hypothetical protein